MSDLTPHPETFADNTRIAVSSKSEPIANQKPRSDDGTIILHWLTAFSMVASLLTGLRISADGQFTTWAKALDKLLPVGEIWTWHFAASAALFFCTISYFIYVRRAVLGERNSSHRLRTLTSPTTYRLRLRAINVALHWFAYGAIIVLSISGTILYFGYGGLFVTLHKALAWAMLFYIGIHTITHFLYGGVSQLLRLFRPQQLLANKGAKPWPLLLATIIGLILLSSLYALDLTTRATVVVAKVSTPPTVDGKLDDTIWDKVAAITVETHQGANLGDSGSSSVFLKAVRTDKKIYFAFRWQDPTRSLMRSPTIKKSEGWYVMSKGGGVADVVDYYEDKFAVLFSHTDKYGGGGSTFLGDKPLAAYPKSPHGRGLHYTQDGRIMDMWQWKSSRGGMLGHMDDMYFGPPKKPTEKQLSGNKRYAGGYEADPGAAIYEYNYIADGPNGYNSPVRLKRLPLDLTAMRYQLGSIPANANGSNTEASQWWMTNENSIPYDTGLDATIPLGTILPSSLNIHDYHGDRADLTARARWKDGYWTLEVSRKLDTKSPYDMGFHKGTRVYLWVSVFDHNQTRHTRHQRPIQLDIE
ncbi:MAG: ethylbenzene dehydrogenase-related protein [Rhizobiaceae bacterium]